MSLRRVAPRPIVALAAFGAAFIAAATASAKPPVNVFDHKDWIGICDNTLRCTVMALAPDGEARGYLSIERDGEPTAAPVLKVVIYSDTNIPSGPVHLHAQGFDADVPGRWEDDAITAETKDPSQIASLVRQGLGDDKGLILSIAKAKAPISLSGAAAALLWMDDRQGRLGSVTALTRKGPKPASALAPAPPLPVYAAAPKASASEIKPVVYPKAVLARPELKDCEKDQLAQADERGAWRLGSDTILWSVPCMMGAYNLESIFFLSDAKGGAVRPAPIPFIPTIDTPEPTADEPPFGLLNADFDPKTLTLSDFEKARGLGDCGRLDKFLWDGKAFQPLEIDYMPECRGVTAEAWPAIVRGREK
jgi:hypothetical protein